MNIPEELHLKQIELGPLNNFIYILGDAESKESVLVDPAWDVPALIREIHNNQLRIVGVWLTHGHPDHVNGLSAFLEQFDVPAFISRHEAHYMKPKHANLVEIDDHEQLTVGSLTFEAILTPGHTPGCQSFLYRNVAITGDAIFIDGCGRCDLPGGDPRIQFKTLYEIISRWPDDTLLFTGHNYGPLTVDTLGAQKKSNPFLTCSTEIEFLRSRMGI
jgi:hydroxyacylglutathione hydrolase